MSDSNDEMMEKIAAVAEFEKRRREVSEKKLIIEDRRTTIQIQEIQQHERELEIAKRIDFSQLSPGQVTSLRQTNRDYIRAARTSMTFMNEEFKGVIPFFRKNLILIGGRTGDGKSTTVANIAFSTIRQINPATNKTRRVLVLTNEEKSEDVYNRVTCLRHGWAYTNHDQFTDDQVDTFDEYIGTLSSGGRMTVIDNEYEGAIGLTTSIEGICTIFDKLIANKEYYDVVIIDYYQNIKYSKMDPSLNEYQVQAMLANALDRYKNVYPAPIVLMAQVNPPDEKETPFKIRIQGRKIIMDVATCAVEMIAHRENYSTQWIIHKSRFNESIGKGFFTGFKKGMYVPYSNEFVAEVARIKEMRMMDKINGGKLRDKMAEIAEKK